MRKISHNYAAARRQRRNLSLPEVLLWQRFKRADGVKLRKQHPVGPYVIDFYCAAAKLGIEIDGLAHDLGDRPERDGRRTALLADRGIDIVRVPATEVLRDPDAAAEMIVAECLKRLVR